MPGTPGNVRLGPGWLYVAAVGSTEPTDLATAWDHDWVPVGFTEEGSEITIARAQENVMVAERLSPLFSYPTEMTTKIAFAAAEMTGRNLQIALNGGEIQTSGGLVTFEPPELDDQTPVAIGWEATDGLERWIFRKCLSVDDIAIPRRKAPNKALIQMGFQALDVSDSVRPWIAMLDSDYVAAAS